MAEVQPCGTLAAIARHRRAGEPLDDACVARRKQRDADRNAAMTPEQRAARAARQCQARRALASVPRTVVRAVVQRTDPTRWQDWAACAGQHWAFATLWPVERGAACPAAARAVAYRFCAACPVRVLCGQAAEANHDVGLWAGKWRSGSRVTPLIAQAAA